MFELQEMCLKIIIYLIIIAKTFLVSVILLQNSFIFSEESLENDFNE